MRLKRPPSTSQLNDQDDNGWLVTYSDAITLLLAFFVILVSVSEVNEGRLQELEQGITSITSTTKTSMPFSELKKDITSVLEKNNMTELVDVSIDKKGIKIEFSNKALYGSGDAEIKSQMLPVIDQIADVINNSNVKNQLIEIEGHTDDIPINTLLYPSNWELSSARAVVIVKRLEQQGVEKKELKAVAYADSRPKVELSTTKDVHAARAANRRAVIYIRRP
ncbi:Flagellar motor rotation protein MotB [Moritella sp. JT01]|uniref:OmpA/MotB family protein n=1 Tax=Moritella sp. JT01 TaxID=756698 RepID=UPI000791F013|nr:OmpA family protein [Moritella sp. JT01]KXO08374.1 Flagellar motor rotation protein MotB [Moritella sp. JT01]